MILTLPLFQTLNQQLLNKLQQGMSFLSLQNVKNDSSMKESLDSSNLQKVPLFTSNFLLISVATLAFFCSNHILTPALPIFLTQPQLTPSFDMGVLMAAFMGTSLVIRPIAGKLCDEGKTMLLMILGISIFTLMPLLYIPAVTHPWFLLIRMIHGIGLASFMTATSAFLSLEIPTARRAEGMSHYANAIKLAMAISPGLGLYFAKLHDFQSLFYLASGFSCAGLLLILWVKSPPKRSLKNTPSVGTNAIKASGKLINLSAIFPGVSMATNSIVFGLLIPFIPMLMNEKGFEGMAAYFYPVYAFTLIFSRALTGPLSDRYGRETVIIPGMIGVSLSLGLISLANHPVFFILSAACYGLSAGTVQPSLMALATDRSQENERGSSMATFTLLNDLGVASGTLLTGQLGPIIGYTNVLNIVLLITILGAVYYYMNSHYSAPNQASIK
ncbi:MAG: MFS transporter [Cyanobacteria bacterium]|nr:MFS transporter [Cyanobacteriota bacterium]